MSKRVSVELAAEELGLSKRELRYKMRTNKDLELSLGFLTPPKKKGGNWGYFIYRDKLNKVTGAKDEAGEESA